MKTLHHIRQPGNGCVSPIHFFIPEAFNAAGILPDGLKGYADCANCLVSMVIVRQAMRRVDEEGYARLKVAYLRKVIPDRVERKLRRAVIAAGVLKHDPKYVIGDHAMGYRLREAFHGQIKKVECKDARLAGRMARHCETMYRSDTRVPVHAHLRGWLERLDIDVSAARRIVESTPELAMHADLHLTLIDMIRQGHVEFSYCKQGRVHSLVTRMAKLLRPTLSINDHPLINIDITNSQPLILATLTHHQPTHRDTPPCNPPTATTTNTVSNQPEVIDSSIDALTNADDVIRYIRACENGTIYTDLQAAAGLDSLTRDQVKVKFYREIFFGRNQVVTDFTRLFDREFPTVMAMIRKMKRMDYSRLACEMQRSESRIMIHGACTD